MSGSANKITAGRCRFRGEIRCAFELALGHLQLHLFQHRAAEQDIGIA
jgi:hypothetical protein